MWLKAPWILGCRGFVRWLNWASCPDGQFIEATAAPVGHVHVPRFAPPTHGARCLRLSEGAPHHACPARKKTACGCCGRVHLGWYDRRIRRVRDLPCGDTRIVLEIEVRRVRCRSCGKVKRERLDFLADNPLYTKRFAHYVGQRCRQATIKDIAEELKLDWDTVKTLEKQYMQAQLARAGRPGPKAIGIDEISIRKGHSYRIVVSDLIRRRPIWFAAYCKPENKVSLGFVEGLNNKIRVIQRRAYGLRDQEYLRLKVLTCMLPAL